MFLTGGQQWDVVSRGWLGENTPWCGWNLINVGLKIHGIMGWERLWQEIFAGRPWKSIQTPKSPGRRPRKSVET